MALNANALVTLAQAKDFLDIPSADATQDTRVEDQINSASDHIEYETNRKLKSASYTHRFHSNNTFQVLAEEFPVTAFTEVNIDDDWVFGVGTIVPLADLFVFREVWFVKRCGIFPFRRPLNVQAKYTAGYTTIPFDLQQATLKIVSLIHYGRNDQRIGLQSKSKLGESVSFLEGLPEKIQLLIAPHKRDRFIKDQIAGFPINGEDKDKNNNN